MIKRRLQRLDLSGFTFNYPEEIICRLWKRDSREIIITILPVVQGKAT